MTCFGRARPRRWGRRRLCSIAPRRSNVSWTPRSRASPPDHCRRPPADSDSGADVQDTPTPGPAQAAAEIGLVALDGSDEGSLIPLLQGELTFGRSAPSDVIIDSRLVSKIHARV